MKMKIAFTLLLSVFVTSLFSQTTPLVGSIDGNFSVSPLGAANYSIPIKVPNAIRDMVPEVTLSYDSNLGNGIAGWGFNIGGISSITRVPRDMYHDGIIKGVQYTSDDGYSLDGQRILLTSGVYGAINSTYKFEVDNNNTVKIIDIYGTGPNSFEVSTLDGITYKYGSQTGKIKYSYNGTTAIGTWYLDQVIDQYGNYILYTYEQDGTNLYAYLKRITYGSNKSTQTSSVEFTYETRTDIIPIYFFEQRGAINKILTRVTSKIGTVVYRDYKLEYTKDYVCSRLTKVTEIAADGRSYNPTVITWTNQEKRNLVVSMPVIPSTSRKDFLDQSYVATDLNGDGISDVIGIFPSNITVGGIPTATCIQTYISNKNGNDIKFIIGDYYELDPSIDASKNLKSYMGGHLSMNLLGNGKSHYLMPWYKNIGGNKQLGFYLIGDTKANSILFARNLTAGTEMPVCATGDINNDGKDELVYLEKQSSTNGMFKGEIIFLNTDNFNATAYNTLELTIPSKPEKIFINDINGDGLNDLMVLHQSGYIIYWNQGGYKSTIFVKDIKFASTIFNSTYYTTEIGDFNGDGLPDFILKQTYNSAYKLALNNLGGNFTLKDLASVTISNGTADSQYNSTLVYDFDNDGKSDIVISGYASSVYQKKYYRSTGDNFELWHSYSTAGNAAKYAAPAKGYLVGDFNGDGSPDLLNYGQLCYNNPNYGNETNNAWRIYSDSYNNQVGKIKNITNGFNNKIDISYTTFANNNVYKKQSNAVFPVIDIPNLPLRLVESVAQRHATEINGEGLINTYYYEGAKIHIQGKGFLGFNKKISTNNNGEKIVSNFAYDNKFYHTTPTRDEVYKDNNLISTIDYSNGITDLGNKRFFSYLNSKTEVDKINNNTITSTYSNYQYGKPKTVTVNYNNVLKETTLTEFNNAALPTLIQSTKESNGEKWIDKSVMEYINNDLSIQTGYTKDGTKKIITEKYTYDLFGNQNRHSIKKYDSAIEQYTAKQYSTDGLYLESVIDSDDQQIIYTYDKTKGLLTSEKDVKAESLTSYFYDSMGRLNKTIGDEGTSQSEMTGYTVQTTTEAKVLKDVSDQENYALEYGFSSKIITKEYEVNLTGGETVNFDSQLSVFKTSGNTPYSTAAVVIKKGEILYGNMDAAGFNFIPPTSGNYKFIISINVYSYLPTDRDFSFGYARFGFRIGAIRTSSKSTGPNNAIYSIKSWGDNQPTQVSYLDGLGREIRKSQTRFDNTIVNVDKVYNQKSLLEKESLPYKGSTPALWNIYEYDTYDRPVKINYASGKITSYAYSANSIKTTDNLIAITRNKDVLGQLTSVVDPAGTTTYTYRPDGQIAQIKTVGDIYTYFYYDDYGRQSQLVDPSMGTKKTTYDNSGNISIITDLYGTTKFEYDTKNRLFKKIYPEFTTTYGYDTGNRLTSIVSTNGTSKTLKYIAKNKLSEVTDKTDTKWLTKLYAYSATGALSSVTSTSQSGKLAMENYKYQNGYLKEIILDNNELIWRLDAENGMGLNSTLTFGEGFGTTFSYDKFGLLTNRSLWTGDGYLGDDAYTFNPKNGNLQTRREASTNLTKNYEYDYLDRLAGYGDQYQFEDEIYYDSRGNITGRDALVESIDYDSKVKPYAMKSITSTNRSGQITQQSRNQDIKYTTFMRPLTIVENGYTATFSYDADFNRKKMMLVKNGVTELTRYYIDGGYEIDIKNNKETERLYLGGDAYSAPVVFVKEAGKGRYYRIYRDYLGSITNITDDWGVDIQTLSYDVWGGLRNPQTLQLYDLDKEPTLFLGRGYTGHEHLPMFGLINMNARLYDPRLGRFLSADPYVQMPDFSQSFNRYSYALNNPLKYTDPNGEFFFTALLAPTGLAPVGVVIDAAIIGAAIGGSFYTVFNFMDYSQSWSWSGFGQSLAVGAVSGATLGTMSIAAPSFAVQSTSFAQNFSTYMGRAGYAALSSSASAGMGMLTSDILDDGSLNNNIGSYAKGMGVAAGMAGMISFGNSVHNYHTWDKFSVDEKISKLAKEFPNAKIEYNAQGTDFGNYSDSKQTVSITSKGLQTRSLARSVIAHENIHHKDNLKFPAKNFDERIARNKLGHYEYTERNAHVNNLQSANKYHLSYREWHLYTKTSKFYNVPNSAYKIFSFPLIIRNIY